MKALEIVGLKILAVVQTFCGMLFLLMSSVYYFKEIPYNLPSIFRQMRRIGGGILPVAVVSAIFAGVVLSLQTGSNLAFSGTREAVGAIIGLSMINELGPVLIGLLAAGRVGSAMAAEVGAMQVNEEVDTLVLLEINPVRFLAMPRLVACLLAIPALVFLSTLIGIAGGGLVASIDPTIDVPFALYYDGLIQAISFTVVLKGMIKAFVFGGIIAQVGCYCGFKTTGGSSGISLSIVRAVALSFVSILIADCLLTRIML